MDVEKLTNSLAEEIQDLIVAHAREEKIELDPRVVDELTSSVYELTVGAIGKYLRGQKEHGGLLQNRDCLAEAKNEVIDLWHYLCAEQRKGRIDAG